MKTNNITLSNSDKLALISTFATMINAGIPILETVDSLLEDAKGNSKKILESLREDLMQGKQLYESFSKFPGVFDKVTINIIKASEEAGTLDVVLNDLKTQIQKDMEFIDRIKSAVTYPIIIFCVFFGVLLVLLVVVIPKIATVFLQLRVDLPLPTKILIFLSSAILQYTIPIFIGFAAAITGVIFLYRTKKQLLLKVIFSFPLISALIKQIDLTRFSRSMYLLLSSGITITSALELTEDVVMRKDISKAIVEAKETIMQGRKLSEAFKQRKKMFSSILIKILEAGEKTGTLDKSMQDISDYMDYQVSSTLKALTTMLEPLMLVFVGLLVGGMMLSIIAPIYGLISQVGAK